MNIRIGSWLLLLAIGATALGSAGCLVKETKSSLSLEPSGDVTWTVLERNIHATADTPADRQREEDEYMARVGAGQHPNIATFRSLGAYEVRSQVVSTNWPFAVLTEGRFHDVAQVFQQVLDKLGPVRGRSVLQKQGDRTTWTINIEYDPDTETTSSSDSEEPFPTTLLDDDGFIVFMRHGQFVDAVGFDISDDGRVATCKDLESHDWNKQPTLALSLTWVAKESDVASKR